MKKLLSLLLLMVVTAWGQIDLKKQSKSDCTTSWLFFSGTTGNINCDTNLKWDNSAKRLTTAGMDISKAGLASLNILGSGDSDNYSFINLGDAQTATKSWYLLHRKEATYQNDFRLTYWTDAPTFLEVFVCETTGQCSFGVLDPTAILHLKAGTAAAGTAPFKLTSGTLLTTPEAGTVEFLSPNLHFTPVGTRKTFKWSDDAPAAHASSHSDGQSDEVTAENLATACTDVQVLGGDGSGGVECQADAGGDGVGYDEVLEEAAGLTKRAQLNFIGTGVTCVDNAGNTRTDCTISGTGGGALGANQADTLEITRTSATVLTINPDATASAPVNVRIGNTAYQFTSTATITIDSGTETCTARTYVKDDGVIYVGLGTGCNIANYTCVGCTKEASDVFPNYSITGYEWGIASGAFAAVAATQDKRGFLSTSPTKCGAGLTCAVSSGIVTVSLDTSALGPDVTTLNVTEEFVSRLEGVGYIGELGWAAAGSSGSLEADLNGEADHPGVVELHPSNGNNTGYGISWNNFTASECCDDLHSTTFRLDWVFKMMTAPTNKIIKLGLANGFAAGDPNNQITVKCDTDSDTNWMFRVCSGGSCETNVDSGVACSSTAWHRFRAFRNTGDASGRVKVCMDACSSSTEFTANVPTVALSPMASIYGDADSSTEEKLRLDYMSLYMEGLARW